MERIATGAATDEQAAAARKAKVLPMGGTLDPYKHHDDLPAVTFLPRRGTELQTAVETQKSIQVLPVFEAAKALRSMGMEMDREKASQLRAWYPEGVPEDQLQAVYDRLTMRGQLRVVAGGAQ